MPACPAEPFTWFAFIFRWMAGVFFAWVFVFRGFGVAVGTHAMYDILVRLDRWRILMRARVLRRSCGNTPLRIVHLSDIHFWRYALNPLRLLSKRFLGIASLLLGARRRFRLERVPELVARVKSLEADHILITGDLTTTALRR